MPAAVRIVVWGSLGVLVAGAVAIVALSGPAMLMDIAGGVGRWLCL
jgi:hypothetical protein